MSAVTIVGGGPVGLVLALALRARGVSVMVLEKRLEPHGGTRSIGIHPPALEVLDELGVGERFVERGVCVRRGIAFAGQRPIGSVDFASCAGAHKYVLAIEQRETERILREALHERAPGALHAGIEVLDLQIREDRRPGGVCLRVRDRRGRVHRVESAFAIACDGRRSRCREALAVRFSGSVYPGGYLMGDTEDTTSFGEDAAVFLCDEGLVESFPLPGARRRWVVRRTESEAASAAELAQIVEARTGHRIGELESLSAFAAERFIAARLAIGRVALAGDAAHVVSPIGGQGMNLGWIGARSLARALADAVAGDESALERDARKRARMAKAAARRAELNMWLGRPTPQRHREKLVRALLSKPITLGLARMFTMRGLAWGV